MLYRFPGRIGEGTYFKFVSMVKEVLGKSRWASHLRNTCRRLRIVAVMPGVDAGWEEIEVNRQKKIF